jgi:hypothetical protein
MALIVTDPTLAFSLPNWKACDIALSNYTPPSAMGFACKPGDLNRLSSRYRLAKSFRAIQLESYVKETVDGYSALFQVFLCYSALEQFMDCCGLNLNGVEPCLPAYGAAGCEVSIRAVEKYDLFLKAVHAHLDRRAHRKQFEAFLSGDPSNVLYLAAGIRHIFAHGRLTPNSGAGYTQPAQSVSAALSAFAFRVMDGEFTARLVANGIVD